MDRAPGLSVRLKLTLSYAGFLMLAGAVLLAAGYFSLSRGVHPGIRPPGDSYEDSVGAQQDTDRAGDLLLHRPQPRLSRPARERAPVVLEQELGDGTQTSSSSTISVESDRRGPSFRIRV